jgi:hypothetical protein
VIGALCSTSDPKAERANLSEGESPLSLSLSARHWSISSGYRDQHSFRQFAGITEQTQRETQKTQVVNYINLFDV